MIKALDCVFTQCQDDKDELTVGIVVFVYNY